MWVSKGETTMTDNQLIQEYEFDPTLTTSELKNALAEIRAEAEEEEHLEKVAKDTEKAIIDFIANPTKENARKASGLVDFHSDYYKDVNGVRPHGCWRYLFTFFTPEHNRVWEECYDE